MQPLLKPKKIPKSKRPPNPQKNSRIIDPEAVAAARRPYCQLCGLSKSSMDYAVHHIKYRSQGGHDIEDNLICLCIDCHGKAHKLHVTKDTLRAMRELDKRRDREWI